MPIFGSCQTLHDGLLPGDRIMPLIGLPHSPDQAQLTPNATPARSCASSFEAEATLPTSADATNCQRVASPATFVLRILLA